MNKGTVIDRQNGMLFSHQKEILTFVTVRMEPEGITLNKINQTEKDTG